MRRMHIHPLVLAAAAAGVGVLGVSPALASNPLEYPDNGSASFSRGGAWLAVANEPIAAHYNPAGLATQGSGFSVEQQLNFDTVCYDRHGPNGAPETAASGLQYLPVCNERASFPNTIPSISVAWRASRKLGIGLAIVPPATYGTADSAFPALSPGYNAGLQACIDRAKQAGLDPVKTCGSPNQLVPSPYRYQQLQQLSTIIFPTLGVGYEIAPRFRVGAAFISGIAVINTSVMGMISDSPNAPEDAQNDSLSTLHTKDLFVPGAILAIHWSPTDNIDLAAWGRWVDDVSTTQGDLAFVISPYNSQPPSGDPTQPYAGLKPVCRQSNTQKCVNAANTNLVGNDAFRSFKFPFPPEVRAGVRFHSLRTQATVRDPGVDFGANGFTSRDPLHDDVFDVELDGSYTLNASANTIEVRFAQSANGTGARTLSPTGYVPPNADKWNGYKNSVGVRLGGQYNVAQDKFGIRAGTWVETQSQDPQWLTVAAVGALRGGFGGGFVVRQDFIDISIGYQYHWSAGLDNNGQGLLRAVTGTGNDAGGNFSVNREPPNVSAADRTQFRSLHTVNDGSITQHAHAFTLGGTVRF